MHHKQKVKFRIELTQTNIGERGRERDKEGERKKETDKL